MMLCDDDDGRPACPRGSPSACPGGQVFFLTVDSLWSSIVMMGVVVMMMMMPVGATVWWWWCGSVVVTRILFRRDEARGPSHRSGQACTQAGVLHYGTMRVLCPLCLVKGGGRGVEGAVWREGSHSCRVVRVKEGCAGLRAPPLERRKRDDKNAFCFLTLRVDESLPCQCLIRKQEPSRCCIALWLPKRRAVTQVVV
jgi:hypothetical protein